ncbi:kinase-like protein, partial [Choiromyces venosus 120613-1]
ISLMAIRSYAQQMFLRLSLLRKCNTLHADRKQDNILICDLGSASNISDNEITPYIVSRFYRAPEISKQCYPYNLAIDMWSIRCTLYKLYTKAMLFTSHANNQMWRSIMKCCGNFPQKVFRRGKLTGLHSDDTLNFSSVENDEITGKDITKIVTFNKPSRETKTRLLAVASTGMTDKESKELNAFIDLLDWCLNLNSERCGILVEALKYPFIHSAK